VKRAVPQWLLERLARGELPPAQAEALRAELGGELDALRASDEEILRQYPAETVTAEVRRRAAKGQALDVVSRRPAIWAFSAVAVAAGAVLLVASRPPASDSGGDGITLRGLQPSLRVYRNTAGGAKRLAAGAKVHAGDTLQAAYLSGGKRYGVVASIDAKGVVTLHLPEQPGRAVALAGGGERALVHSFRLDDTPGFERFLFVAGDEPFATEDVARALARGAPLPSSVVATEVTLIKETP
jgi:hypothetical protein